MKSGTRSNPAPVASPAKNPPRKRRIGIPLAILAAAAVVPVPAAGADELLHIPSLCPFHRLTGLPCPGCGMTRSLVCLAHGHLQDSVGFHPLGGAVFLALMVLALARLAGHPIPLRSRTINIVALIGLLALVVVWIARLLHWLPAPP